MQGEDAAADMAEMVIRANEETEPPDILIIARGGGAEEDLTPFNQRVLLMQCSVLRYRLYLQ